MASATTPVSLAEGQPDSTGHPRAILSSDHVDFGHVAPPIEGTAEIEVENYGDEDLLVTGIETGLPGLTGEIAPLIRAGGSATLHLVLTTEGEGRIDGSFTLLTNDPDQPEIEVTVTAILGAGVSFSPRRAVALSVYRSEARDVSRRLQISNLLTTPLQILGVEAPEHVAVAIDTVEAGAEYALEVSLRPDAPAGRREDQLLLKTNRGDVSVLLLTLMKERVYANPPDVDFGTLDPQSLARDKEMLELLVQRFSVFRRGSDEFTLEVISAPSWIEVSRNPVAGPANIVDIPRRGPTAIIDFEVEVKLDLLTPGEHLDQIVISTSDPDFPRIEIPVSAVVIRPEN